MGQVEALRVPVRLGADRTGDDGRQLFVRAKLRRRPGRLCLPTSTTRACRVDGRGWSRRNGQREAMRGGVSGGLRV